MKELRGRNALLTGAAGGLGGYIARALTEEGVRLAVSDISDPRLDQLRDGLRAEGAAVDSVGADLAKAPERDSLVERAEAALGPLDILVNNAGVELISSYTQLSQDELDLAIAVNLTAPMVLTRQVIPGMIERGRGHVVNVASLAGKLGLPYAESYCATKFGLVGFTQSVRVEYSDDPIGFSVICPGLITEAGMYARIEDDELRAPSALGTLLPQRVSAAVVKSIRKDLPEVIVNRRPIRPLLMLGALRPRLVERLVERAGIRAFARRIVEKRGRL